MESELATWHFAVAGILFALLGVLAHVVRAVFNLYPDKLSDTPIVNIMVSGGYSWADHLWGTEYDDAGYYRLDSLKNLKLSVVFSALGGLGVMLMADRAGLQVARLVDAGLAGLVELFWYRVAQVTG